MKKKVLVYILAAVLAVSGLAACGSDNGAVKEKAAEAVSEVKEKAAEVVSEAKEEAAEAVAEAQKDAAEDLAEAQKDAAEAASEAADKEKEQAAAETPSTDTKEESSEGEEVTPAADGEPVDLAEADESSEAVAQFLSTTLPVGGLKPLESAPEQVEMSEEQQQNMDRAMRDYTPSEDTLLVNNAKKFYYYSKMNDDQKAMYDAMMMVAEDPANPDNVTVAVVSTDLRSEEFVENFYVAYYGMLYDHAELFWLYNGIETDMGVYEPYTNMAPEGKYQVYFALTQPYENYEKQMTKFNNAVNKFLADIDTSKSKASIAKQIHNKLVNKVTYNTPVSVDDSLWGYKNFAHTAYGALVADSDGNKNYAVCDGYSQAYVYLCQQCGITAAVIVGVAGYDSYNAGGHAWSVVKLGDDWYEVDSTWDDPGSLEEQVEGIKSIDEFTYNYFREAFDDKDYQKKCRYYLFNVTTDTITNFVPDDYYNYYSKDGMFMYSLIGSSVHYRASEDTYGYEDYGFLMDLAPKAKGTKYAAR